MSKRASGPPRRPRNPIARAVRTPQFRQRVEADKRNLERLREQQRAVEEAEKAVADDEQATGAGNKG